MQRYFPISVHALIVSAFIARAFDPHFDGIRAATPVARKLVDRALGPGGWPTIKDRIFKEGQSLFNLVKDMESIFAHADRDQMRVRIHPADIDGLEKFISHLFRRVVTTISGVGLAIVTSLIYVRSGSLIVLTVGLFVSLMLIGTVFLLPNPQRYPFRMRRARRAGKIM